MMRCTQSPRQDRSRAVLPGLEPTMSKFHLAGDTAGVVITSETDYADGTALTAERADRRPGHGLAADDRLLPP
jgi:hypothetical protein